MPAIVTGRKHMSCLVGDRTLITRIACVSTESVMDPDELARRMRVTRAAIKGTDVKPCVRSLLNDS